MGVRSSLFVLGLVSLIGVAPSCNIDTCEGGNCSEGDNSGESRGRECATYCARLSLCEAPQSADFEACVRGCEQRFQEDRQKMAELCVCAEHSDCRDLIAERCPAAPGVGGSSGSGGSHSGGNAGSGAGAGGSAGGSGGSSGTGSCGNGGASAGASGSADAGQQTPCARDCDCPLPERCVGGYCAPA